MGSRTEQATLAAMETSSRAGQTATRHAAMQMRDGGGDVANYFQHQLAWQRVLSAILLLGLLPVIAIAAILVRTTSRGPVFYWQTRVGLRGRHFQLIKIRSMRMDAEAGTGPVWTTSLNDDRITRVGRVLRWTHIDELPQLWNVLRGEMALVGPRPERPEFIEMLVGNVPGYLDRLAVLPGITGLAQINLPPDEDAESVRRKLALDQQYIRRGSLTLDLRILACTAIRLVGIRSLWLRRLLRVSRDVPTMVATKMPSIQTVATIPSTATRPRHDGAMYERDVSDRSTDDLENTYVVAVNETLATIRHSPR